METDVARAGAPQLTTDIKDADRVLRALDVIIDHLLDSDQSAPKVIEKHSLSERPRVGAGLPKPRA